MFPRNADKFKKIADYAQRKYFGNKKNIEMIRKLGRFTQGVVNLVARLNRINKKLDKVNDFLALREEKLSRTFFDYIGIPGEEKLLKLTKNQRVMTIRKYLKKIDNCIGKVALVVGAYELIQMYEENPTPQKQLKAFQKTWNYASGFGLNKIYPGYGKFMSKAFNKVVNQVKILNWEIIKMNVEFMLSTGYRPEKLGVEFSGSYSGVKW